MEEYELLFSGVKDEYLRERLGDLRDVLRRVARHAQPGRIIELGLLHEAGDSGCP